MAMDTIGNCGGEAAQAQSDDEKRMVCTQTRFASVSDTVQPEGRAIAAESRIAIELVRGYRLSITGSYDPETLARLIRNLSE
jgi:hypothetical protein